MLVPVLVKNIPFVDSDNFVSVDFKLSFYKSRSSNCVPFYPMFHYCKHGCDDYVFLKPSRRFPFRQITLSPYDVVYYEKD